MLIKHVGLLWRPKG